ncbi:NLR family CARD domain-containing protein 4-like [Acanthaster planci]|uniref:NLR family CARD domain-containing protein 4-like n=1 Tax=Acanthaster planci TaxID=133434 RepID=A0A8B7ZT48_ACAPL|nr:NLR family CARD domain-containing protein 4-like [Acanthaster planci]
MEQVSLGQWDKDRITTGAVCDHPRAKLISKKMKAKHGRKAAFLSVFPIKASSRLTDDDKELVPHPKRASTPQCELSKPPNHDQTITKAETESLHERKEKLQVFVRGSFLSRTLCLQLDQKTSVSSLKELIKNKSGIQPQTQHLFIQRNLLLCDSLSLTDQGIQQDQNIEIRAGGLLGGAPEKEQFASGYFLELSEKLGRDWVSLAINLDFDNTQVEQFEEGHKGNIVRQSLKMLDKWYKKQDNPEEAPQTLKNALRKTHRADLASKVPGVAGEHFDVEQCAEELTAHYQQTLKVTTHPTKRGTSVEIGRLYVNQQLLEETNLAAPSCSSEFKIHPAATMKVGHLKGKSQRGTPGRSVSKVEEETGFLFQNVPLDSYEDMLTLKTNRILATAEAGYGKTTLLKKIVYDWVEIKTNGTQQTNQSQPGTKFGLKDYKLVFLIEVNRMGKNFDVVDAIFSQILTEGRFEKEDLEKYIRNNQKSVLILLDGADEISLQRLTHTKQRKDEINLSDMLSFKSLKSCKIVVTSRQKTANELLTMHEHFTKVHVAGFDEKDREKYVGKYLTDFSKQSQKSFLDTVNASNTFRSLAEIPLFLWLMCFTWAEEGKLPHQITKLFSHKIEHLFQRVDSKETDSQANTYAHDTKTDIFALGRLALEGLLDPDGPKLYFMASEINREDSDIFEKGCKIGLLSKTETVYGLTSVTLFSFLHKTFQEYCAAVYLDSLSRSDKKEFHNVLSSIFSGDVESVEFLLRFCCGLNKNTAQTIIREIDGLLGQDKMKESLHRISTLLLFEAQLDSLVDEIVGTGNIKFTFEIQGEDLVAAHYLVQTGSKRKALDINSVKAKCDSLEHLKLLKDIVKEIECNISLTLNLANVHWSNFVDDSQGMIKHMKRLDVRTGDWNILQLFDMLSYKESKISTLVIKNTISFELLSEQMVTPGPIMSLTVLALADTGMKSKDIESLLSLLSSAGSIKTVLLKDNDLHGLQAVKISPIPSLCELQLHECSLTKTDIEPIFSLLAAAASIKTLVLKGNDLHGLQPDQITSVPSLRELYLYECNLTKSDIEQVFSLLAATGNIQVVVLNENDLQRLQPAKITPLPSLCELHLYECNLSYSEIGPLFSLLTGAGSIKKVFLKGNNLRGLEPVKIEPAPLLSDLQLQECGLTNSDIKPLFSLLKAAGSVETVALSGCSFRRFQVDKFTPVSSCVHYSCTNVI